MDIRSTAKSVLARFLDGAGMIRLRNRAFRHSHGLILMYHRILPRHLVSRAIQPAMFTTAGTFRNHVRYLKANFDILPLSEFFRLKHASGKKPVCVITFDDGWVDFYRYAYPVLTDFQVPATVFLPTEFIGTCRWFWTDRLAHNLLHVDTRRAAMELKIPAAREIASMEGAFEDRLENAIAILKGRRLPEIEAVILEMGSYAEGAPEMKDRMFLNWDEVREMYGSGLVSFGSHTAGHQILTMLQTDEIRFELQTSLDKLKSENLIDARCVPLCYPNGAYNETAINLAGNIGYDLALSTRKGWTPFMAPPFTLKRIGVHQDVASGNSLFAARISGLL